MMKAIIQTLIYYFIGFSITVAIYLSTDTHYAHGPNLYHITFVLTVFFGTMWFVISSIRYWINRDRNLLGYIYVNGIVAVGFAIMIVILMYQSNNISDSYLESADELIVARSGDSTMIYENENLVFLQVQDSVHLDLRDSAMKKVSLKK